MTDEPTRPDGGRTVILIPLPDARPRPSIRENPAASSQAAPDVHEPRPAPAVQPSSPVAPAPTWTPEPDEEDAVGEWHIVRPVTGTQPRPRARAASPTGRGHLTAVAVAVPAAGATGILVSVVDTLSTALAAVLPIATILGVVAAWLFLSRIGAWARSRIEAAAEMLRR